MRLMFWIVLTVLTCLRVLVAALMPPTIDEPYHWLWPQHPAWGYFDHPPLAAWMGVPFTLLGSSLLAMRAAPLLAATATAVVVFSYTRQLTGSEIAASIAGMAFAAAPYYSVMAVIYQAEFALLLTWGCVLWTWHNALFETGPGRARRWIYAGVALGLCLLAKLTALALVGGLVLFFGISPRARSRWLRGPWPWTALGLALLVASPLIIWNAHHGWPNLAVQAARGSEARLQPGRIVSFLAESAGGLSPLIAIAMVPAVAAAIAAAWRDTTERLRLPLAISLPVLAAVSLTVPFVQAQVYWTLCGYLGLFPLLALWFATKLDSDPRRWRRWGFASFALAVVPLLIGAGLMVTPRAIFGVASEGIKEMYAWPSVSETLEREAARMPRPFETFLAADDHRIASQVRRLTARPVMTLSDNLRGREYLRFVDIPSLAGQDSLLMLRHPSSDGRDAQLRTLFDRVVADPTPQVAQWGGLPAFTFYLVRCYGFHPDPNSPLLRLQP